MTKPVTDDRREREKDIVTYAADLLIVAWSEKMAAASGPDDLVRVQVEHAEKFRKAADDLRAALASSPSDGEPPKADDELFAFLEYAALNHCADLVVASDHEDGIWLAELEKGTCTHAIDDYDDGATFDIREAIRRAIRTQDAFDERFRHIGSDWRKHLETKRAFVRAHPPRSAPAERETDTARLDWLEEVLRPGTPACEVYFAGLRHRNGDDAVAYQIEGSHADPEHPEPFETISAPTLRAAIDQARAATPGERGNG
jgi:hypothetical protein